MNETENRLRVDYRKEDDIRKILPSTPRQNHHLAQNHLVVQYYEQPPGEMPENRTHQHLLTVHLDNERGIQEHCLDGKKFIAPIADGQISLFPAHSCHGGNWNTLVKLNVLILEPQYLSELAHESVDGERVELRPILNTNDPIIYNITSLLHQELKLSFSQSPLYVDGLATALSAHLLRQYCTRSHRLQNYQDGLPQAKLQQAIDFIQAHLSETLSLDAIAQELGMSRYYFCRLFKASMGISPYQYLLQCRIERAKELLVRGKMSSAQVAIAVGFTDQSHFIRHFKKFLGVTPKKLTT